MKKGIKQHKMLLQGLLCVAIFAVALFSVFALNKNEANAADFEYKDFDWDTFQETNKTYWQDLCTQEEEEKNEKCKKKMLKTQEKFYKRLYKMLATYQMFGLTINDNIILQTVTFNMTPSEFNDPDKSEGYKDSWNTDNIGIEYDENMDDENISINVEYSDSEEAQNYFAEEKDTLKILIQNMIAYDTNCFGIHGDPELITLEDGSTREHCPLGGTPRDLQYWTGNKRKCVDLRSTNELGFWEYYLSKYANDVKLGLFKQLLFLDLPSFDPYFASCKEIGESYPEGHYYEFVDVPNVSTNKYFDFLMYNKYYDNKLHLQTYFKETVLKPAGVDCMTNKVCDNSLENAGLYETYEGEILLVRKQINLEIIEILENFDPDLHIEWEQRPDYDTQYAVEESQRRSYYWPIGSDETEERNGVVYADKEPASTEVVSYFGTRTNPVTGEEEFHTGIDIAGVDGTTNVIAVYNGEVISVVSNCSSGDTSCNEGYGNTIILSHSNGDYTVYAHLASIDSSVTVGATVQKGQLIGKVGSTGETNSSNLHYEIRMGENSAAAAVDPLGTTSETNPRPQPSAGDFSVHETSLTREEFISLMVAYCNSHNCRSEMRMFVNNAGEIYDVSIAANVNPELVVVRAMAEGFSPGGGTNNYWGIRCYNGQGVSACSTYGSLADGIRGFASAVSGYENVSDMMSRYAYIGRYWFNPGSWSNGGCPYYPYIKQYMSETRSSQVAGYCGNGASSCSTSGGGGCHATIDEDQKAYAIWQVNDKMAPYRYNVFGL